MEGSPTFDDQAGDDQAADDHAARCLFVVSRDVAHDVSAAHLLRVALWDGRRGATVTVFLVDEAIGPDGPGTSLGRLEALSAAGALLIASCGVVVRLGEDACRLGVTCADDAELAALLRAPGMRAVWC
jgi:hypothetical protein